MLVPRPLTKKKNSSDLAENTEGAVASDSATGGTATSTTTGDPVSGQPETDTDGSLLGSASDIGIRSQQDTPQSPSRASLASQSPTGQSPTGASLTGAAANNAARAANPDAGGDRSTEAVAYAFQVPPDSDSERSTVEAPTSEAPTSEAPASEAPESEAASASHSTDSSASSSSKRRIDASAANPVPSVHVSHASAAPPEKIEASVAHAATGEDTPVSERADSEVSETPAEGGLDEDSAPGPKAATTASDQVVAKRESAAQIAADAKPGKDPRASANEDDSKSTIPGVTIPFEESRAREIWRTALATMNDMTPDHGAVASSVAISGPNRLVVRFSHVYTSSKSFCERAERRQALETTLAQIVGKPIRLEFELIADRPQKTEKKAPVSKQKLRQMVTRNPFVERAVAVFEAEVIGVDLGGNR